MSAEATILEVGRKHLAEIDTSDEELKTWQRFFAAYRPRPEYPDDAYIWLTGILALTSLTKGNFGIGSILVNDIGDVIIQGHNEIFTPYFRSDRHAEMVVMNRFEKTYPEAQDLTGYTLYTSLEPCPMCLVRLSSAGIANILFAAFDEEGGMVHNMQSLPPFWKVLAQRKKFMQAQCSNDLIDAAEELFFLNLEELMVKIEARSACDLS